MRCKLGEEVGGLTAGEILNATGGALLHGSDKAAFSGISIDSRGIEAGELFWAIKGERFDGNDFIEDVFAKGAAGLVTDRENPLLGDGADFTAIKVDSSLKALQALAAFNRKKHPVPLIGITGSNGKTTTKELLASILKGRYEVLKSEGNLNNLIGVPLTLLRLHSNHEAAVVEMGMNKRGEIRELTAMSRPDIGIITNIGEAHLEGLGSIENIGKAKGELIETMEEEKSVVLNADDASVMNMKSYAKGEVVTFGIEHKADFSATDIEIEWGKGTLFMLSSCENRIPVLLPLYGIHQLYNALAAAAAASLLGFDLYEIREGLEAFEAYSGRMEIITENGINVINDSYNANPPSLRHAIETMNRLTSGRKIAVLGDMHELGENSAEIHRGLGAFVAAAGIDNIVTVGRLASKIADGAVESGMEPANVHSFDEKERAFEYLDGEIKEGDWVLVKGSRGMKMDEITWRILESKRLKGEE